MLGLKQILLFLVLSFCFTGAQAIERLTIVMEASYPPFESFNDSQQMVGLDIELGEAICEYMIVECEFYHQPFSTLLGLVANGHYDISISAITVTEERSQYIAFTAPYWHTDPVFVVSKNLQRARLPSQSAVGVQTESVHQKMIQSKRKDLFAVGYGSYQRAFADLEMNNIEAVFVDRLVANHWLKNQPNFSLLEVSYAETLPLAIAVSKENTELLQRINLSLEALQKNGQLDAIYGK